MSNWPQLSSAADPSGHADMDTLFAGCCRCHGAIQAVEAPRAGSGPRRAGLDPHISMRTLRPFVNRVRRLARSFSDRFDQWDGLHDDDRVSVHTVNEWLDEASRWLRDPALGLSVLEASQRGCGDMPELVATYAPTLDVAVTSLIRHAHLVCEAADFHLHVSGQVAALQLRYRVRLSQVVMDFVKGTLLQGLKHVLGNLEPVELWLTHASARRSTAYAALFPTLRIRTGARDDAIVVPAGLLQTPMPGADPVIHATLLRCAAQVGSAVGSDDGSLSDRVRRLLRATLGSSGDPTTAVTKTLRMSRRSLTRYLQKENTSLYLLRESVRKERALHYVEQTDMPTKKIAELVGFATTATFCRAFMRWTLRSPLRHRSAVRATRH